MIKVKKIKNLNKLKCLSKIKHVLHFDIKGCLKRKCIKFKDKKCLFGKNFIKRLHNSQETNGIYHNATLKLNDLTCLQFQQCMVLTKMAILLP